MQVPKLSDSDSELCLENVTQLSTRPHAGSICHSPTSGSNRSLHNLDMLTWQNKRHSKPSARCGFHTSFNGEGSIFYKSSWLQNRDTQETIWLFWRLKVLQRNLNLMLINGSLQWLS